MDGSAVLIGAGVGGLTAAIALRRQGWDVTVYERAPGLEAVGAGLAMAPNALVALDTLGLGAAVRALAALQGGRGHPAGGRPLVVADERRGRAGAVRQTDDRAAPGRTAGRAGLRRPRSGAAARCNGVGR
jgi:2-polyprenyl-6-methoxyphenol hydroxylase-like FAD-dependent oxidoreductase